LKCRSLGQSDTRWLAHECCVKVVKENYCTIVITFNNIYKETHEPEALEISKALSKKSTISAMFLLDYVLPQVVKLSKTLQTENLGVTVISSLVEAPLHSIDDALSPTTNWVMALQDREKSSEETILVKITVDDIKSFQDNVGIPFVFTLKTNISIALAHKTWYLPSVYLTQRKHPS